MIPRSLAWWTREERSLEKGERGCLFLGALESEGPGRHPSGEVQEAVVHVGLML